jgi:hypothetical protein
MVLRRFAVAVLVQPLSAALDPVLQALQAAVVLAHHSAAVSGPAGWPPAAASVRWEQLAAAAWVLHVVQFSVVAFVP